MSARATGLLRKTHHRILAAVLLAFATTSCSGARTSIVGASGLSEPASMQATSGDAQTGTVGATLPDPISVGVTTKSGKAVAGASVDWSFTNGTGSTALDGTGSKTLTTVTDKSGVTAVYWTLDTIAGDQEATATLKDASSFQAKFHSHGEPSKPSSINVSPSSVTLTVGQPMLLAATVLDKWGNVISGTEVKWRSADSGVAVVDSTGLVTGEAAGRDTITATDGSASGQSSVIVKTTAVPGVAKITVSPDSLSFSALGGTATLAAKALDSLGNQVTGASISWSSTNPGVASVDQGGVVTSKGWGQAFIVAAAVCCSVSDTAAVTVQQPATTQPATGYYGEVWNDYDLTNLIVGGGAVAAYRFRAEHTGYLDAVRIYFKWGAGYSLGDGGEMQIEVQTDDGTSTHFPSGTVIGTSETITDPQAATFQNFTFNASPPSLTKGQLYHLVFVNPAPDPVNNYTSIDNLYLLADAPNMQPTVPDLDLAVLEGNGAGFWQVRYDNYPIADIRFSDGFVQGQGYIAARRSDGTYPITSTAFVRERFTVTNANRSVTSVRVRLRSVTGDGRFTIRLEDGNGTLIEEGTATASTEQQWQTLQFRSAHELAVGSTYDVVLSAPAGNQLEIYVLQEGAQYGFQTPTQFLDGHAQYYDGAWHDAINGYMDFQLYFTVAPM